MNTYQPRYVDRLDKDKKNRIYLFFIAACFLCKAAGLEKDSKVYLALVACMLVFLAYKFVTTRWTRIEFVAIMLVGAFLAFNVYTTHSITLMFSFVLLLGVKNLKLKSILLWASYASLLGAIIHLALLGAGVYEDKVIKFWRIDDFIYRHTLGYSSPNSFTIVLSLTLCLFFLTYWNKIRFWMPLLLIPPFAYAFMVTQGRTGLIGFSLLIVFFYVTKIKFIKIFIAFMGILIQPLFITISYLSTMLYGTKAFHYLDVLTTGRLAYTYTQLKAPVSFFGRTPAKDILLDNSYSLLPYQYGVIVTALLILCYVLVNIRLFRAKRYEYNIIFCIISCQMFTESYYPNFILNFSLIAIACYFFSFSTPQLQPEFIVPKKLKKKNADNIHADVQP